MNPRAGIRSTACTLPSHPYRTTLLPYTSPGAEHIRILKNAGPDVATFGCHPLPERGPQLAETSMSLHVGCTRHTERPFGSFSVHMRLQFHLYTALIMSNAVTTDRSHPSATARFTFITVSMLLHQRPLPRLPLRPIVVTRRLHSEPGWVAGEMVIFQQ
jgi:hypothetical protein